MKTVALALAVLLGSATSDEIELTATSVNVAQSGTPVKIKILRWSKDEERAPIVAALNPAPQPSPARNSDAAPTARGRAGRGRGRGGPAAPLSPIAAFTAALGRAQTIGYIWTNDITGYSIKYAWHSPLPDGGDRIVLVSDRRLGAYTAAWKTTSDAPVTDYSFTLIELHVGANGSLEGKSSLATKIALDAEAKTVALDNYPAGTVTLTRKPVSVPRPASHP
jgi:hypothetical protein